MPELMLSAMVVLIYVLSQRVRPFHMALIWAFMLALPLVCALLGFGSASLNREGKLLVISASLAVAAGQAGRLLVMLAVWIGETRSASRKRRTAL